MEVRVLGAFADAAVSASASAFVDGVVEGLFVLTLPILSSVTFPMMTCSQVVATVEVVAVVVAVATSVVAVVDMPIVGAVERVFMCACVCACVRARL